MSIHTTGVPIFSSVSDTQVIDISNVVDDLSLNFSSYTADIVLTGDTIALQKYTTIGSSKAVTVSRVSYDYVNQSGWWLAPNDGNNSTPVSTSTTLSLNATSGVLGGKYYQSSDDRLKHNEIDLSNCLPIIMQLEPKIYQKTEVMLDANYMGDLSGLDWTLEAGFIAQKVLDISALAFCVEGGDYYDNSGNVVEEQYSLNYQNINIFAIQAIKELNQKIDGLINQLQNNNII